MLAWLYVWSLVQTCIWPSWCHCHSLSLASVKSRLVLPFWYWLTQVVLEKEPLNGCVCLCFLVYKIIMIIFVCCRVLQDIAWERWMWDWAKWSGWWTKSSSVGPTLLRLWSFNFVLWCNKFSSRIFDFCSRGVYSCQPKKNKLHGILYKFVSNRSILLLQNIIVKLL